MNETSPLWRAHSDFLLLFSCQVRSNSSRPTPWTTARQASLSFTMSWSLLKLIFIQSVMPSNHLILCHPLLLLPSIFPSIRVFSKESALHNRWPKYWSFISPSNEYWGWFPLGSTSLISLLSKGLWSFSNTTVQKINSIGDQPSSGPTFTSIYDYWENHSFDYMDLCWQSSVSSF